MRKTRPVRRASSRQVTVRASPLSKTRALVHLGTVVVPAAIGRSGRSAFKREGDGATPIGPMRLLSGFLRGDRLRGLVTALPMVRTRPNMLWCDASGHASYNRPVRAPFTPSHEQLMRDDGLYDVCLVLDWNVSERRRNLGSAIFFHLIRPGYEPTAGCIAVKPRDMIRLLRFMRKGTVVRVIG